MSRLNILSGGAAQGLVASLAPRFKAETGFDIAREFGAVGTMTEKLRGGMPTDVGILTTALIARLAEEKLVVPASIADVGAVETALAVRSAVPKSRSVISLIFEPLFSRPTPSLFPIPTPRQQVSMSPRCCGS